MVGARSPTTKRRALFYFMLRTFTHTHTAKSRESAFASRGRATVTNHKGNYVKRILAEPPSPSSPSLAWPRPPQQRGRGGRTANPRLRLRRKLGKYAADDYLLRPVAFAAASQQFQPPHATRFKCACMLEFMLPQFTICAPAGPSRVCCECLN